jgi:uncharacterized SAM-dependent methyltransferase
MASPNPERRKFIMATASTLSTTTSPQAHKLSEDLVKLAAVATTSGIASKYWLELISLPAGNNNRLWLFVGSTWTHLANASVGVQASVQNAFNAGSNLQVAVWYDATQTIIGLVVRTP